MNNELKHSINKLKNNINELKKTKNNKPNFLCFKLIFPDNKMTNKKFIAFLFSNHFENKKNDEQSISSIFLKKKHNIINYCLTLKMKNNIEENNFCSFALAIKENNKVKIIKGSKINHQINSNDLIHINNTILYNSNKEEELCLITSTTNNFEIISDKSFIKILCM